MRAGLVLAALAMCQSANAVAETPARASIAPVGETVFRPIDLVPWGWKLFDKIDGDLNSDGRDDTVLVIQRNDPALMMQNENLGVDRFDANPRVLVLAMRTDNGYRVAGRAPELIPDHDMPTMSDPYDSLEITNGAVRVRTRLFMNAGGWGAGSQTFTFRWNGEAMALIGFDRFDVHRGSGETQRVSANYLTGKRKDAKGNIADDTDDWRWSDLRPGNRPVMGEVGNAFTFES